MSTTSTTTHPPTHPSTGRVDAVLTALLTAVGLLPDVGRATRAAAWGACRGAASAGRAAWVADRPRRRAIRTARRRAWWRRGGWRRALVAGEVVGVGAWVVGRSAGRAAWAARPVSPASRAGAAHGWRAAWDPDDSPPPGTRPTPGPGPRPASGTPDVVDVEVVCTACGAVLGPAERGTRCTRCTRPSAPTSTPAGEPAAPAPSTPDPAPTPDPAAAAAAGEPAPAPGPAAPASPAGPAATVAADTTQEDTMNTSDRRISTSLSDTDTDTDTGAGAGAGTATTSGRLGGELAGVGDLSAEVAHLQGLVEVAETLSRQLTGWAKGLPEQVEAAPWRTGPVTATAVGVAEASSTGAIRDAITGYLGALDTAGRLGESLAAVGARGRVEGLSPQ